MKLKRGDAPGYCSSADGLWKFIRFDCSNHWAVYRAGDDEPATYNKFPTRWEAVDWAEGQEVEDWHREAVKKEN